uniref:Uncharacterized protein n=1 Tax=Arundo donax TaxID=35708 RepID=A0A0A9F9S5_ARUDO
MPGSFHRSRSSAGPWLSLRAVLGSWCWMVKTQAQKAS